VPSPILGSRRTAEDVTNGIDLTGKLAVVTGCNSGIGHETMRILALRGAHVIGTGRTKEKAHGGCTRVEGRTTPVVLELSDFRSVISCADEIGKLAEAVDILICNAGMMASATLELVGGVEKTFATNHLGHFLFVNRLLPRITASRAGRVVVVSSDVAYRRWLRGIDFNSLRGEGRYAYMRAYAQSKLANALFSRELARRLRHTRAASNAVNPGFVRTNIENRAPTVLKWMMKLAGPLVAKTPAQGAATTCYVATVPQLEGVSGEFFQDCRPLAFAGKHPLNDDDMAAKLWGVSEELIRPVGS
jgi:NAD(P)-dependent dehydrogenase (short-subunit alcohol dehydrogenase family)